MSEYNFNFDWNRISTLGKVKVLVEQVVGSPSQEAINTAVAEYIEAHPGSLSPLSAATKAALLQIAEKVAYVDEHGQDYYDALDAALNARALLQITAVYTQTGTVYDTDSLDSLKADLVVTAYYDDGTTADVTSASVLSGTLTEGTSVITATYGGKSATFNVTVTAEIPQGYTKLAYLKSTGTQYIDTGVLYDSSGAYEVTGKGFCYDTTKTQWYLGAFNGTDIIGLNSATGKNYGYGQKLYYRMNDPNNVQPYVYQIGTNTGVTYTAKQDGFECYMDGTLVTTRETVPAYILDYSIYLFARNNTGTADNVTTNFSIAHFIVWDANGDKVCDMIPCLDANDVPCMYDTVTGATKYNIGTGTFEYEVLS